MPGGGAVASCFSSTLSSSPRSDGSFEQGYLKVKKRGRRRVKLKSSKTAGAKCFCLLWQGIENIRNEIQDTMEPLIDPVHGHGRYEYTLSPSCSHPGLMDDVHIHVTANVPLFFLLLLFSVRAW